MSNSDICMLNWNNDAEYGSVWDEGEDAYKKGLKTNPYPKRTLNDSSWNDAKKHLGWNDGFHHAQYLQ